MHEETLYLETKKVLEKIQNEPLLYSLERIPM